MGTGVYLDAQAELIRMGNYLRNRADALTGAWETSLGSADPADDKLRALDEAEVESERYDGLYRTVRRGLSIPDPSG